MKSVEDGTAPEQTGSLRQKCLFSDYDPVQRKVTYGFADSAEYR